MVILFLTSSVTFRSVVFNMLFAKKKLLVINAFQNDEYVATSILSPAGYIGESFC